MNIETGGIGIGAAGGVATGVSVGSSLGSSLAEGSFGSMGAPTIDGVSASFGEMPSFASSLAQDTAVDFGAMLQPAAELGSFGELFSPEPTLAVQSPLDFLQARPFAEYDSKIAVLNSPSTLFSEIDSLLAFANESDDVGFDTPEFQAEAFMDEEIASDTVLADTILTSFVDVLPKQALASLIDGALEDKGYQGLSAVAAVRDEVTVNTIITELSDLDTQLTGVEITSIGQEVSTDNVAVDVASGSVVANNETSEQETNMVDVSQTEEPVISDTTVSHPAEEVRMATEKNHKDTSQVQQPGEAIVMTRLADQVTLVQDSSEEEVETITATLPADDTTESVAVEQETQTDPVRAQAVDQETKEKEREEEKPTAPEVPEFIKDEPTNEMRLSKAVTAVETAFQEKVARGEILPSEIDTFELPGSELPVPVLNSAPQNIEDKSAIVKKMPIDDQTIHDINEKIERTVFRIDEVRASLAEIIENDTAVSTGQGETVPEEAVQKVIRNGKAMSLHGVIFVGN